jgi:hypothetical protein
MSNESKKMTDAETKAQVREQAERLTKLEELGTRAVACKGWRWMSGMLGLSNKSSSRSIWIRIVDPPMDDASECWPDFSDPATLGCLLALVREAWKVPDLAAIRSAFKDGSVVWSIPMTPAFKAELGLTGDYLGGATQAEALVAALEAAPVKKEIE